MSDNKADAAYHPSQGTERPGLCTCFPFSYSPARPVSKLTEIAVIDPHCKHHGDAK